MKSLRSCSARFRQSRSIIGLILAVSAFPIGIVMLLHHSEGIPIGDLTRDPISIARAPLHIGFLSQIGIFFWSASATVCLFSAQALPRCQDNLKIKRFLVVSGILTLVLGLDDAFLFHEELLPDFGIPQKTVVFSYVGIAILYLARFHSLILRTEYILLGIALTFFGASVALDLLKPHGIDPFLFEDGAKLVGIVSWLAYFYRTGKTAIDQNAAYKVAALDGDSAPLHRRP
jgi:hypothetical protein